MWFSQTASPSFTVTASKDCAKAMWISSTRSSIEVPNGIWCPSFWKKQTLHLSMMFFNTGQHLLAAIRRTFGQEATTGARGVVGDDSTELFHGGVYDLASLGITKEPMCSTFAVC
jgi:hypothetical protein